MTRHQFAAIAFYIGMHVAAAVWWWMTRPVKRRPAYIVIDRVFTLVECGTCPGKPIATMEDAGFRIECEPGTVFVTSNSTERSPST